MYMIDRNAVKESARIIGLVVVIIVAVSALVFVSYLLTDNILVISAVDISIVLIALFFFGYHEFKE